MKIKKENNKIIRKNENKIKDGKLNKVKEHLTKDRKKEIEQIKIEIKNLNLNVENCIFSLPLILLYI